MLACPLPQASSDTALSVSPLPVSRFDEVLHGADHATVVVHNLSFDRLLFLRFILACLGAAAAAAGGAAAADLLPAAAAEDQLAGLCAARQA